MDDSPSVAIITLTWNQLQDTLECLDSVRCLDYPNYCVVLVDNGSSDGTVSVVRERFPEAHIIENGCNLGYAGGNNEGVRFALANGYDSCMILNNDTVVDPAMLRALVHTARQHDDVGVLCPTVYFHSQPNVIWFGGGTWAPERANFFHVGFGEVEGCGQAFAHDTDFCTGCALFFKMDIVSQIGLFDPRFFLMFEEIDWCYRARRKGYRTMIEPRARVWHKGSASFGGDAGRPQQQYYLTRNRLLWIEKNLTGWERIRAFRRCFRECARWGLRLMSQDLSIGERSVLHAQLLGVLHYCTRRLGQGPVLGCV